MREFRPYGSVRGVPGNWHPYRDKLCFATYMSRLNPAQKAKLLQEAISESAELPQTMEAVA